MIYPEETMDRMIADGNYHLIGDIGDDTLFNVVNTVPFMPANSTFTICSGGGDVASGRAISDLLNSSQNIKKVVATGSVMSSAAIIFLSSTKPRFATPSTVLMVHQCHFNTEPKSHLDHHNSLAAIDVDNAYMRRATSAALHEVPDVREEALKKFDAGKDVWFTARELEEYGILSISF